MKKEQRIIIVGAGLSGISLAYFLSEKNMPATILEGSLRIGGRIQTIKGSLGTPLEIGATWFSDEHKNLLSLLKELDLQKFPQYSQGKSLVQNSLTQPAEIFQVPQGSNSSYRVEGGTSSLISALREKLPPDSIKLDCKVTSIVDKNSFLEVRTKKGDVFHAEKLILCLPPQLIGSSIQFSPSLPEHLLRLLPKVQTWMAGSVKFVIEYDQPFWREKGLSGMLFSRVGIVNEMYDHVNYEEDRFGFTGFLNGGAASYTQEERKQYVFLLLEKLLGKEANDFLVYSDKVWTDEFILGENPIIYQGHQNNGDPLLWKSYMQDKLFYCGTECSHAFPGYMEGAIISAKKTFDKLYLNQT